MPPIRTPRPASVPGGRGRRRRQWLGPLLGALVAGMAFCVWTALAAPPLPGAIFTTDSGCTGVNLNIYSDKGAVYLDGGPAHMGAAGLADGSYYVQVTDPNGNVLGTSVGSGNDTPLVVTGGEFAHCYQLSSVLIKASDSTPGYDDSTVGSVPGGFEYKVWVSTDSTFSNSATKTDAFKIRSESGCEQDCGPPPQATLNVLKFYDANANGVDDDGQLITGWRVHIQDDIDLFRDTPAQVTVAPDNYTVTESTPIETNWVRTTTNPVTVTLVDGDTKTVEFGNLCVGAGGGLTLGFWSNQNGQKAFNMLSNPLGLLMGLYLRSANGSNFDPTTYAAFKSWLLSATATNMAYMLSAQLAAMELNVASGKVNGGALIFAPGTPDANALGFATVTKVMADANTALGADGSTFSGDANRAGQEALKNALDNANNNKTFVQATPCGFTFAGGGGTS